MEQSPILAIITDASELDAVNAITHALGYQHAEVIHSTPHEAALQLQNSTYSPRYIMLFIADRRHEVLPELDMLAEQCEANTRVVVIGETNDIGFYRALKDRGVVEYFNYPPPVDEIRNHLFHTANAGTVSGKVFAVMGGSSGDGSSMVALNTAYLLAKTHKKKVVLVDLDYQFGMVARQLELQPSYSVKEIFDHPDRGVDSTLIERMVVHYREGMDIVASPQQLHFMPTIEPDLIREFVSHLSAKYEFVILDIPHLWNRWVSSTISFSDHIILVAQLLLKSITHSTRLLNIWTELGLASKPISIIVNRSGSRYKEAVHPKDFERILGRNINYYLPNDIKTICQSENRGLPISDIGKSQLANELEKIARSFVEQYPTQGAS